MANSSGSNSYQTLIEGVFFDSYKQGLTQFEFAREDLEHKAS
jgi:hypothetical protein